MEQKDLLVDALIALCKREGGYKLVADSLRASHNNLWQIIHRTALPSGNARGVGPKLRKKLNEVYPGWLDVQAEPPAPPAKPAEISIEAAVVVRMIDRHSSPDRRLDLMTACVNAISQFETLHPAISAPDQSDAPETSGAKPRA